MSLQMMKYKAHISFYWLLIPQRTRPNLYRPRGLMDKASDFGSEDCEFESRRGQNRKFSGFYEKSE